MIERVIPLAIRVLGGRSGRQMDRDGSKIGCHTRADPICCNSWELNGGSSRGRERERDVAEDHTLRGRIDKGHRTRWRSKERERRRDRLGDSLKALEDWPFRTADAKDTVD
jgi:hypothetical protein